jgi:hypothetical protein
MHGGWQIFSPTLLVEVEGSLLKRRVGLYALVRVWRRGERVKHMLMLACLTSLGWAGHCMAWRGEVMGPGTQRAHEWFIKIQPKVSQVRDIHLLFIFLLRVRV